MSTQDEFNVVYAEVCERCGWTGSPGQVDVKLDGGRHQIIHVEFFEHAGRELARLATVIGSIERIRAEKLSHALRMNYGLPHGALAVRNEELVMVDTMLLGSIDAVELEASIRYLAEMADGLEASMYGPDAH